MPFTLSSKPILNTPQFIIKKTIMRKNKNSKKRFLNHFVNVGMAIITASLIISPSLAVDPLEVANQAVGYEGGREAAKRALDGALKVAKSKPAMSAATGIVCLVLRLVLDYA